MISRYTWNSQNFESLYVFPDKNILISLGGDASGIVPEDVRRQILRVASAHMNLQRIDVAEESVRLNIFNDIFLNK